MIKRMNKATSLLIAAANSAKVSNAVGALPFKALITACTNAVLANCVLLVAVGAVGAVGVPIKTGEFKGALVAKAAKSAVDKGLSKSLVLSTLPNPISALL